MNAEGATTMENKWEKGLEIMQSRKRWEFYWEGLTPSLPRKAKALNKEWYSLRSLWDNENEMFEIQIGERGAGKSFYEKKRGKK